MFTGFANSGTVSDDDYRYLVLSTPIFTVLSSLWIPLRYSLIWGLVVLCWVWIVRYDSVDLHKKLKFINKNENVQALESFAFNSIYLAVPFALVVTKEQTGILTGVCIAGWVVIASANRFSKSLKVGLASVLSLFVIAIIGALWDTVRVPVEQLVALLICVVVLFGYAFMHSAGRRRAELGLHAALTEAKANQLEAERAKEAKSVFLANMSHELRTPLTAVLGFSRLLALQADLSPQARPYSERCVSAGQLVLNIINDTLDFSRLEASNFSISPKPTAILELAQNALEIMSEQARAKGLTMELKVGPGVPAVIQIDGPRLQQVLLNTIGNAIKFTNRGRIRVSLRKNLAQTHLKICIIDTGRGISADQRSRLFRRYSRIDQPSESDEPGTGLGLEITRGIVHAMQGQMGLTSVEAKGSAFWVSLPLGSCPIPEANEPALGPGPDRACLSQLRVLVADDNVMNRQLLKIIVAELASVIIEAEDGLQAVGEAFSTKFDVILMDIRMPQMDGVTAAAAIRSGGGPNVKTPIIAFTAGHLEADIASSFEQVVVKPIVPSDLLASIAAVVSMSSVSQDLVA